MSKTPKNTKPPQEVAAPRTYATRTFPWAGLAVPPMLPASTGQGLEVVREPHHRPFLATARLRDGVVIYDAIHLDGLIQVAAIRQHEENGGEPLPDPNQLDNPMDIPIPLARWAVPPMEGERVLASRMENGRLWGWCASAMVWRPGVHTQIEVRKRTPIAEMAHWGADAKVDTAAGPYKPWDTARPKVIPADYRAHFFGLGDVDRVRALLQAWITHIGKLSGHGNGAVLEWIVEEVAQDFSLFGPQGQPMRTLPARAVPGCKPSTGRLRGPYWHGANACLCAPRANVMPCDVGLPDPLAMLPKAPTPKALAV